jgi:hypothetical protein
MLGSYVVFVGLTYTTGMSLFKAISNIRVNQEGLKLNGTNQLLVYVDNFHILGGSVHTIKINTQTLVVASNGIGLDVSRWPRLESRTQDEVTI